MPTKKQALEDFQDLEELVDFVETNLNSRLTPDHVPVIEVTVRELDDRYERREIEAAGGGES